MSGDKSKQNRQDQILDAALELFLSKGYERTSVSQIVGKVGIAQGTFYYHFLSKEAVLFALVERAILPFYQEACALSKDIGALESLVKVIAVILRIRSERGPLVAYIHQRSNILLHEAFVGRINELFLPVLAGLLERGACCGDFHIHHTQETASFLLATAEYLFDSPHWEKNKLRYEAQLKVAVSVIEGLLGLECDTIDIRLLY